MMAGVVADIKNFLFREDNERVLARCKEGDLLKFHRLGYSHWAVYVGNGRVIHLTEDKDGNAKGKIREDDFWDVEKNDRVTISNDLDETMTPFPGWEVVKRARFRLRETGYNLLFNNCEHFANWCRYGVEFSKQARVAASLSTVARAVTQLPNGDVLDTVLSMSMPGSVSGPKMYSN